MTITRDGHARASHLPVRHMHMNVREIDVDTHHRYHRVIIFVSLSLQSNFFMSRMKKNIFLFIYMNNVMNMKLKLC